MATAEIVTGIAAFLGAGIGAAATSWATLRSASADRQERHRTSEADRQERRREEWGRRFSDGLAAATSADPISRATGRALLRELLTSELATDDDRRMAEAVLMAAATGHASSKTLTLTGDSELEDVTVVRDTEDEEDGGGST